MRETVLKKNGQIRQQKKAQEKYNCVRQPDTLVRPFWTTTEWSCMAWRHTPPTWSTAWRFG